jgi:hypothetical protein
MLPKFDKLITELSQNTILQARRKHDDLKDKNPVAAMRQASFDTKAHDYMLKKNSYIRAKTKRDTNQLIHYYGIYLRDAKFNKNLSPIVFIRGVSTNKETGFEEKDQQVDLEFSPSHNELRLKDGENSLLFLNSRQDAETLAKFIRVNTGIIVNWKQLDFINQADHINQYSDKYAI